MASQPPKDLAVLGDQGSRELAATSSGSASSGAVVASGQQRQGTASLSHSHSESHSMEATTTRRIITTETVSSKQVEELHKKAKEMESKYVATHSELQNWRTRYDEMQKEYMENIDLLKKQLRVKEEQIEKMEATARNEDHVAQHKLIQDVSQLRLSRLQLQTTIEEKDNEIHTLEARLKNADSTTKRAKETAEREAARLKERNTFLEARVQDLEKAIREFEKQDSDRKNQIQSMADDLEAAIKRVQAEEEQQRSLQTRVQTQDKLIADLRKRNTELEAEVSKAKEHYRSKLQEMEQTYSAREAEILAQMKSSLAGEGEECSCEKVIKKLIKVLQETKENITFVNKTVTSYDIAKCQSEVASQLDILKRIRERISNSTKLEMLVQTSDKSLTVSKASSSRAVLPPSPRHAQQLAQSGERSIVTTSESIRGGNSGGSSSSSLSSSSSEIRATRTATTRVATTTTRVTQQSSQQQSGLMTSGRPRLSASSKDKSS